MSLWLKQSTAVTVKLGPFTDDTDFKTAETALTISQADIRLSKNGGAFAQSNNVAGATHDASGYYGVPLDATDTNTLGTLRVFVAEAGALQVWQDFMILPANIWDSLFGADKLQVDAVELLGTAFATPTVAGVPEVDLTHLGGVAQSAADLKDFADDGYDPVTNKVQGVVLVDTLTTYTGNTPQTGDSFARLGAPAGASVSADVAAIKTVADAIKAKTDQLIFTIANKVDASIQAAADFAQAAADKVWLSAARTLTAFSTALALSVWDVLETAILTASSIGLKVKQNLDVVLSTRSSHTAADVWAAATRLLTAGTNIVLAKGVGVTGFNDVSAADVRAEVQGELDETIPELAQAIPPATPTTRQALMLPYMTLRNKLDVDATSLEVHNDAGTVIAKKTLSDDGTTYSEAEMVAGP